MKNDLFKKFQQIDEVLKTAKRVFIASHENPDPDAIGSVLALHHIFQRQNKKTVCYLPNPSPARLSFLPGFFELRTSFNSLPPSLDFWSDDEAFDIFFCLDYGDFRRLRLPSDIKEEKVITIDHHLESDQRGRIRIIEPNFSSTSEIIYLWLKSYYPSFLSKEIASCLLTGIVSDTGGFSHICTSSQTLQIVSELLEAGAPLNKIVRQVFSLEESPSALKIWGKVLSRIENDHDTGLVYSWLSAEDLEKYHAGPTDLARISSLLSTIPEANLSLFLVEWETGRIEGSLRSEPYKYKKSGTTAASLAEALGGGGHAYAAGFRQEGTIESVLKKVLKLLE